MRVGSSPLTDEAEEPGVVVDGLGSRYSDPWLAAATVAVAAATLEVEAEEGGSVDELTASVAVGGEAVGVVEEGCDVMLGKCKVEYEGEEK